MEKETLKNKPKNKINISIKVNGKTFKKQSTFSDDNIFMSQFQALSDKVVNNTFAEIIEFFKKK